MHILLVEDDLKIADFIKKGLSEQGDHVEIAYDGLSGKKMVFENDYDLVILDVILPYVNGFELCRQIRMSKSDLPVLLITILDSPQDKIMGFKSGADDYLVKPFHFEEFLLRIRALHRRRYPLTSGAYYKVADLEMDSYRRTVCRSGKEILLTSREFSLLEFLIINKNRVVTRDSIAKSVWGINFDRGTNVITVYINYLRSKIDKGFDPPLIYTLINEGYVLKEP
jgi:two-component system copper resistance phosphate regulon response regulator CusR